MTTSNDAPQEYERARPQKEHQWLERLVGDWNMEAEASMGPDQPPVKMTSTETFRSLDGLWYVGESTSQDHEGESTTHVMTLGYNPQKGRYVGTWIGSEMTHLWIYDGSVDASGRVLTLASEGPSMTGEGTAMYHDIIEWVDDDHRLLRSEMQMPDGKWQEFMVSHYHRRK